MKNEIIILTRSLPMHNIGDGGCMLGFMLCIGK